MDFPVVVTESTAYGNDIGRKFISEPGVRIRDCESSAPQTKEEKIKDYIATVHQLRKQEGIFLEMANHIQSQRNSIGGDFVAMTEDLLKIRKEYDHRIIDYKDLAKTDSLENIKQLEDLHSLILDEMIYRIYISNDIKSNKITLQMHNLYTKVLNKNIKTLDLDGNSDSEIFKGEDLPQDLVQTMKNKLLEFQIINLNKMLHKIAPLNTHVQSESCDADKITNQIALMIQNS
ncbi:hypothetical protein PGT21_022395 [Puccinia graminis f. sp. tritici]|uniref:Uncharacterized protein n=1 Tax=Puccinia graminis f. sp. tritici TaxID=56615 RepID=A0A5B0R1V6_PUCGR|nr:hypothetical protein PGT21_022395 [Puccinia graminis f. sp. tritici]